MGRGHGQAASSVGLDSPGRLVPDSCKNHCAQRKAQQKIEGRLLGQVVVWCPDSSGNHCTGSKEGGVHPETMPKDHHRPKWPPSLELGSSEKQKMIRVVPPERMIRVVPPTSTNLKFVPPG
eukprot:1144359-Pelagomonas_calceolata.AAC.2